MKFIFACLLILTPNLAVSQTDDCMFFCDRFGWHELDAESTAALIEAGADVEERDAIGRNSPLIAAAMLGDAAMTQVLLDAGADVNGVTESFMTPIRWASTFRSTMAYIGVPNASEEEYLENLRVLIDAGANVNVQHAEFRHTPLNMAIGGGNLATLDMLIAAGADLELQSGGRTSLMNSVSQSGQPGMAALLIAAGADVNARGPYGATALRIAVIVKPIGIVQLLLNAGADIHAVTESGDTILMAAAYTSDAQEKIELLIDAGAGVNFVANNGWTVLHYAVRRLAWREEADSVFFLLEAGGDGSLRNEDANTPFDLIKNKDVWKGSEIYLALEAASQE